ncbi:MAG: putative peroxidase-related enzyme [Bacteroidia bacterium]|jgi:uncharacterized peroxidase-related enzyme
MAFVHVITPECAEDKLAKIYKMVSGPDKQVDQVLQVHSLRPHTLEGHMALYKAVLHHRANKLPEWFLEVIGVLVSRINGCAYCDQHHTAGMKNLMLKQGLPFDQYNLALKQASPGAPFTALEQAALAYVDKLSRQPSSIARADIELLQQQGFDDGEILEINQVAAYFAYANRTVSGLGVTTEGETLGLSPGQGEGREAWQHD